MCNYSIITACLSNIVTGIGVVGFPKIKIKRKSKKNFQILLSLCLSTGRQHRRKEGPPSCQDAALFGCLYKLRIRELGRKGRLFESGELFERVGFLYQLCCLLVLFLGAKWWMAHYHNPKEGHIAV